MLVTWRVPSLKLIFLHKIHPWNFGGSYWKPSVLGATVDGRNPAPVGMIHIPLSIGFYTSQVVQDFFLNRMLVSGRVPEILAEPVGLPEPRRFSSYIPLDVAWHLQRGLIRRSPGGKGPGNSAFCTPLNQPTHDRVENPTMNEDDEDVYFLLKIWGFSNVTLNEDVYFLLKIWWFSSQSCLFLGVYQPSRKISWAKFSPQIPQAELLGSCLFDAQKKHQYIPPKWWFLMVMMTMLQSVKQLYTSNKSKIRGHFGWDSLTPPSDVSPNTPLIKKHGLPKNHPIP